MTAMTNDLSERVRGKTIRFSWTGGPTQGTTQEHLFHQDGTVEWHSVESDRKAAPKKSGAPPERVPYTAADVTDDVCMVSYLSHSGYTLTVVLNFPAEAIVGVASNEKNWFPVRGSFELMD